MCEVFREYLLGADHFVVFTDNNPLLYIMQSTKVNGHGQRWVSNLSEYNFSIRYRPGKVNKDADCLSRMPLNIEHYNDLCTDEVELDTFQAIVAGLNVQEDRSETWRAKVQSVNIPTTAETSLFSDEKPLSTSEMKSAQQNDNVIKSVMKCIESNDQCRPVIHDPTDAKDAKLLFNQRKNLYIDNDGILRRKSGNLVQLVLPSSLRQLIYTHLHEKMGHLGTERVFQLARQRVYWPRMFTDINEYIQRQCSCVLQKKPHTHQRAPLQKIITSTPMELVAIDFVHLEKSSAGFEYMLVIIDHFSRYAQAYPTRNKSAQTAAKHLYGDFILRFGIPARILHDQGGEFDNKLFAELHKLSGLTKSRTTPYHPMCNGSVERYNQTLLGMLRTLDENQKHRWHEKVNKMIFAYNSTKHESTGYSPFYLLFGREPKLPIDTILGTGRNDEIVTHSQYAKTWRDQMTEAYRIAADRVAKRKEADQRRWSENPMLTSLRPGDRVLIKNVGERGGPGKLRSHWEQQVYVVKSVKDDDGVVYAVQPEGYTKAKVRVLHRNLLMPCGSLPTPTHDANTTTPRKIMTRSKAGSSRQQSTHSQDATADDADLNVEEENGLLYPNQYNQLSQRLAEMAEQTEEIIVADEETVPDVETVVDGCDVQVQDTGSTEEVRTEPGEETISYEDVLYYAGNELFGDSDQEESEFEGFTDDVSQEADNVEVEYGTEEDGNQQVEEDDFRTSSGRIVRPPRKLTYVAPGKPAITAVEISKRVQNQTTGKAGGHTSRNADTRVEKTEASRSSILNPRSPPFYPFRRPKPDNDWLKSFEVQHQW